MTSGPMNGRMLNAITPIILTYNEAPNIGRTLENLDWAKEIVIVDSDSTDGTIDIAQKNPRVRLYHRPFDSHHNQWAFATQKTDVKTPWILRLDADYQLSQALIEEISKLDPDGAENSFEISFEYAVFSQKLIASLYPPNTVLLRQGTFSIRDGGHTERWDVEGPVGKLKAPISHDDWKPMAAWVGSQVRYMTRELDAPPTARHHIRDWLRRHPPLMPIVVFFYCFFVRGLIFNGRRGLLYTLQRTTAEAIFALLYLEKRCRK
jgi:glycosyltransferase involved in cell wall biosynthesis